MAAVETKHRDKSTMSCRFTPAEIRHELASIDTTTETERAFLRDLLMTMEVDD